MNLINELKKNGSIQAIQKSLCRLNRTASLSFKRMVGYPDHTVFHKAVYIQDIQV